MGMGIRMPEHHRLQQQPQRRTRPTPSMNGVVAKLTPVGVTAIILAEGNARGASIPSPHGPAARGRIEPCYRVPGCFGPQGFITG